MDRMNVSGPTWDLRRAGAVERLELTSHRVAHGVVHPLDDERAAQLGELARLPSLSEVLAAWTERIAADQCRDDRVPFNVLRLTPSGLLSRGKSGLPVTYRVFGHTLRGWCSPPRNIARCLIELPVAALNEATLHSPRSCAFNAYLERHNAPERARLQLVPDEAPEHVTLRSRLLRTVDAEGKVTEQRTIIGEVTDTHSGKDGDDQAMISALALAFAGSSSTARASAFRGIEESELRAVFPALEVSVPGAGPEKWTAYVTARNSESGAKSWSISAGLYRTADGATVACEALQRTGRHVGKHVAERMVEVAEGAAALMKRLVENMATLAAVESPWSEQSTLDRLRDALAGTVAHDPDTCCGIAWELGERSGGKLTAGALVNALGRAAAACQARAQARPLEVLAGRVLVEGWSQLKAIQAEGEVEP